MNDNLDLLIKDLGIIDDETRTVPSSEKEKNLLKIQLLVAQIIADDVQKIKKASPHLSDEKITDYLLFNWTENLKSFVSAMLSSDAIPKKQIAPSKYSRILSSCAARLARALYQ
jgi:hypothetical protein